MSLDLHRFCLPDNPTVSIESEHILKAGVGKWNLFSNRGLALSFILNNNPMALIFREQYQWSINNASKVQFEFEILLVVNIMWLLSCSSMLKELPV